MKKAIQRFIRDDKGNAKVVLIDAQTLQPVLNPAEYSVINQTQLPYWEPVQDVATPDVPSKVQPPAELLNKYIQQSGGDPNAPAVKSAVQTHAATGPAPETPTSGSVGLKAGSGARAPEAVSAPSSTSAAASVTPADVSKAEVTQTDLPDTVSSPASVETPAPSTSTGIAASRSRSPNPNTAAPDPAAPSKGMAALTDKYGGKQAKAAVAGAEAAGNNISYTNQKAQRNEKLNPDVEAKLSGAVTGFFGPGYTASIVSGKGVMKDANGNPSKKGNHNHPFGTAADLDVFAPDGTKVDSKAMADFGEYAAAQGFTGVGGPDAGYMGEGRVHLDTQHKGFASWNVPDRNKLASAAYLGNTQAERVNPGIPEARPTQPNDTVAGGIINSAKTASIQGDPSKVSPAQMAGLGLMTHPRTPDQISRMAAAFAGELSPESLEGLMNGDETAKKELAGMISTAENRAVNAKSFDAVFDPSQYNSMMASKQNVTKDNYAKYGTALRENIAGFYTGALKPESYDPTSYYNPDISTPAWGSQNKGKYGLMGAMDVGNHRFGSVADRSYGTTDLSGSDNRPTEGAGHFGAGGLGRELDSPSEGGGRFGGSGLGSPSPGHSAKGGSDSPSESGGRFGGTGLGSSNKSSKDKDKDSGKSQGPSGGGYGGWGGPH